jgi:hypothetical protein
MEEKSLDIEKILNTFAELAAVIFRSKLIKKFYFHLVPLNLFNFIAFLDCSLI